MPIFVAISSSAYKKSDKGSVTRHFPQAGSQDPDWLDGYDKEKAARDWVFKGQHDPLPAPPDESWVDGETWWVEIIGINGDGTELLGVIGGVEGDYTTWDAANPNQLIVVADPDASPYDAWLSTITEASPAKGEWDNHLNTARASCFKAVDFKSKMLILGGFVHNAKSFSMSPEAQSTWHGLKQDSANLSYPIVVNTIDDLDTLSIADVAAVDAFYSSMTAHARANLDSGTAIKNDIRAATSLADILGVADTR